MNSYRLFTENRNNTLPSSFSVNSDHPQAEINCVTAQDEQHHLRQKCTERGSEGAQLCLCYWADTPQHEQKLQNLHNSASESQTEEHTDR